MRRSPLVLLASLSIVASQQTCSRNETSGDRDAPQNHGGDGVRGGAPASEGGAPDRTDPGGSGPATPTGEGGAGGAGGAGCEEVLPLRRVAPPTLEETGFFSDPEEKTVADELRPFAPRFALWSDGAEKTRWLYLPVCGGAIDTFDMENWVFPVGTYAFKRFVVDDVLVETRLIHKYGPTDEEVLYATYVWDETLGQSILDDNGHMVPRIDGDAYTVPNVAAGHCARCHGPNETMSVGQLHGLPSRFLGLNAIDLSHAGSGLTIDELIAHDRLSHPPTAPVAPPGDPIEIAALGYLHANCGYCHNDSPLGQDVENDYFLRLRATDSTVEETGAYVTAVNVAVSTYASLEAKPCTHRIYGGNPDRSCIHERMGLRPTNQMPPLDTNRVDDEGRAAVAAWIDSLTPP